MKNILPSPRLIKHDGVWVARDDLIGGGTKARYILPLFEQANEIVYATPAQGGAQTALAWAAKQTGKKATLFVAARKEPHERAVLAKALGAQIMQVRPGYLNVVQKHAKEYCRATGSMLAPFGMDTPAAIDIIAAAAKATGAMPDEVWCASGSGTLARALANAWPNARRHVVQVGRKLTADAVAGAVIHIHPQSFASKAKTAPPFPSDWYYDAKAWQICQQAKGSGTVLFWNVTGPP